LSRDGHDRVALHVPEDAHHRGGWPAQCPNLTPVLIEQSHDAARGGGRLIGGLADAGEEEVEPGLPVPLRAHAVQQVVVGRAVRLEVEAQVAITVDVELNAK